MNKPEMNRRINTMSPALAERVHALILAGNGAHSITLETTATLKQVNAVLAWTHRYGPCIPQPKVAA